MANAKQIERALMLQYGPLMRARGATLYTVQIDGKSSWFIAPRSDEYDALIVERAEQLKERKAPYARAVNQ